MKYYKFISLKRKKDKDERKMGRDFSDFVLGDFGNFSVI